eukprot:1570668-Amphidinium_carterae.1
MCPRLAVKLPIATRPRVLQARGKKERSINLKLCDHFRYVLKSTVLRVSFIGRRICRASLPNTNEVLKEMLSKCGICGTFGG